MISRIGFAELLFSLQKWRKKTIGGMNHSMPVATSGYAPCRYIALSYETRLSTLAKQGEFQ